ncbi:MAG TPA: DNA-binding domain-containing protein [Burkholderiales bacterium]
MRELSALQARFGAALDGRDTGPETHDLFVGPAQHVGKRLAIYRGNTLANAARAIAAAYPVVGKIVGAEFLCALARQYRLRYPSQSGDLNDYGESFAVFLADFPPAAHLPYLADVARLEWQVHRAHYAADPAPFDPARLAALGSEEQLQLRPRLHPACGVLHSPYPLARIWQVHQDDFSGDFEVDFSTGATHALVLRPRFRVEVVRTGEAETAFLSAALDGLTLEAALAAALSCDAAFDLGRSLSEWVAASVIVDFKHGGE